MRCPKCGFISFDHLTTCNKCGKDITDVAAQLQGTTVKVDTPMFLSSALAAFADREAYYGGPAMDSPGGEGIDFSMEDETAAEETIDMAEGREGIDFSFEGENAGADISIAAKQGGAGGADESDTAIDINLEAEAVEGAGTGASEESFEELDLVSTVEEEEDGGLEFDLEDFIDDMEDDETKSSRSEDFDIDMDDEEK